MSDTHNVIVVGAGWYGLAAAKTYIELHPTHRVLVIEAESTCGGTWSKGRLYPGLKSNNLWGSYEYPDFPMSEDIYGVGEGQHIPAEVLHRYLTDYARHFGVLERTRFGAKVVSVEATEPGGWIVNVALSKGEVDILRTDKLIMATGLTSEPNIPSYPGRETFTSRFIHAKDFCANAETVNTCRRAVVVGAGKSAFDCAYAFATAENNLAVDLIIRPTGDGPVWIAPPYVTPLKRKTEDLLSTRALTWFSPCPWGTEDGYGLARKFLHGSGIGRFIVLAFWNMIGQGIIDAHGYSQDPEVFKLKPWQSVMWTGSGLGIHNFDTNFFDLVKQGRIRVHLADITSLANTTVYLTNGEEIQTDIVICATGWKKESALKYINFSKDLNISREERAKLANIANHDIHTSFPMLKDQPVLRRPQPDEEPLRNYRFIVPAQAVFEKNIAYAGMVSTVCTSIFASVQSLWISAFFDGKLSRMPKTEKEIIKEVMLHTQFGRWRYPCGYGAKLPDFAFDSIPYIDLLMNDLGLESHRKDSSMAELVEPYKPKDYGTICAEWATKNLDSQPS
ncbi:hypothetical protein BDV06DRAFT_215142 [Aspergillus oleicola]